MMRPHFHRLASTIFTVALSAGALLAQPKDKSLREDPKVPLQDLPEHQAALRALAEGMPEVAAVKWERILESSELRREDVSGAALRLVDASVRARLPDKAAVALTLFDVPEKEFWLAQCDMLRGRLREAENHFKTYLKNGGGPYESSAKLALGAVIAGQGREATARKEFKNLTTDRDPVVAKEARILWNENENAAGRADSVLRRMANEGHGDPEAIFVTACAYLEKHDGRMAERTLRRVLDSKKSMPPRLRDAYVLRLVEAYRLQPGRARTAERLLNQLINGDHPSAFYETAFSMLRELDDGDADVPTRLMAWAFQPKPEERRALALFHLASIFRDLGRYTEAAGLFETFRTLYPDHLRDGDALRLAMECYGAMGADDRVLELANEWRNRYDAGSGGAVDYLTGMIRFSRKEFGQAMALFSKAAAASTDLLPSQRALYNMAVSAFFSGDTQVYAQCLAELQKSPETSGKKEDEDADLGSKLELERCLQLASKRDAGTEAALQAFIKAHPGHPRLVEANIALAEYYLLNDMPLTRTAQSAIDACAALPAPAPEWAERIDYIKMWIREADGDFPGVAKAGLTFLERWPDSTRRDQVRMTVAQALYRAEDYAAAMAQFELLVEENAESPFAEAALFFAGKSSMAQINAEGLDHAIELWSEVAQRNGPLANEARRQQAIAKRREGKEGDALAAIESLLTAKTPPVGEERLALLVEKGELLMLLAPTEPKSLDDAVVIFRDIQKDRAAPRSWRSRAGVLLSQCYERMGKVSEALEVCHDVVESSLAGSSAAITPTDYRWLYRAGFAAIRLLEERKQWDAAANLAERLAKTGGDQAEEAKKLATRILTEHFIWDK